MASGWGSWGWERGGGSLFFPPLNAALPAGVVLGLLAANRAFAVWALADASGYNQEPESSSHGMRQGRAERGALGWEFPAGVRAEPDLQEAAGMPRCVVAPWTPSAGSC